MRTPKTVARHKSQNHSNADMYMCICNKKTQPQFNKYETFDRSNWSNIQQLTVKQKQIFFPSIIDVIFFSLRFRDDFFFLQQRVNNRQMKTGSRIRNWSILIFGACAREIEKHSPLHVFFFFYKQWKNMWMNKKSIEIDRNSILKWRKLTVWCNNVAETQFTL